MFITVLKSKIHQAAITECNVDYEGSIEIDTELIEAARMQIYEKVLIANVNNGERFDTYIIPGPRGSRKIGLNGAAALLGKVGDRIIIFSFAMLDEDEVEGFSPTIVVLDEHNNVKVIK